MTTEIYVKITPQCKRKYRRNNPKYRKGWMKKKYKVLGFDSDFVAGETDGHGYVVLCNDYMELWWVSNRDVRVVL